MNIKFLKVSLLIIEIIAISGLVALNISQENGFSPVQAEDTRRILRTTPPTTITPTPIITPPSQTKIASPVNLKKDMYTIAIIGDSMVDTMGDDLEYLKKELQSKYPGVAFVMYNYGKGSENVVEAINRFGDRYSYKSRTYPPLSDSNADILIVGSYAYNPLFREGQNHWLSLADLIQRSKQITPKVYVLAEIAPLQIGFGEGEGGVNWPLEISIPHVEKIVSGLNNAIGLAETLEVGLIDVYSKSRGADGYGLSTYVSSHDGIHPSIEGHELTAQIIANTLTLD